MSVRPQLALSFDFEDWHQLVGRNLGVPDWDRAGPALEGQTLRVLDLLDELGVQATFFLLGMSVANHRDLVREIVARGHEPACHGYAHERVHAQTPDDFRRDVERCVELIQDVCGRRPVAYRAPAFSINRDAIWAYELLAEAGFRVDSSQHDSPRVPRRIGASYPWQCGTPGERPFRSAEGATGVCSPAACSCADCGPSPPGAQHPFCIFTRTSATHVRCVSRFHRLPHAVDARAPRCAACGETQVARASSTNCGRSPPNSGW